jgi:hypothetical protein
MSSSHLPQLKLVGGHAHAEPQQIAGRRMFRTEDRESQKQKLA